MMVVFDEDLTPPVKIGKKNPEKLYRSPLGKYNFFNAPIVTEPTISQDKPADSVPRSGMTANLPNRKPFTAPREKPPPVPQTSPPSIPMAGIPASANGSSGSKVPNSRPTTSSQNQPPVLPKLRTAASTPSFEVKRKPSVTDLLSRLNQSNQPHAGRLLDTSRESGTRNVSSPLSSTSSTFPSFSTAKVKSPHLPSTNSHGNPPPPRSQASRSSNDKQSNAKPQFVSSPNNIINNKPSSQRSTAARSVSTGQRSGSTSSTDSVTRPSSPRKKTSTPQNLPISRPIAVVDLNNARPAIKEPSQVVTRKAPPLPLNVAPPTSSPQLPTSSPQLLDSSESHAESPALKNSPVFGEETPTFLIPPRATQRRPSLPAPFLNIKTRQSTNELKKKNSFSRQGSEKPLPPPPASASSSHFPESPVLPDTVQAEMDEIKLRNKQLRKLLNDTLAELDQANVELAIVRASRDALQHQVHGYKQALERPQKLQYMLQDDEFARNECLRFDLNADSSTETFNHSGAWLASASRFHSVANSPPGLDSSDSGSPVSDRWVRK